MGRKNCHENVILYEVRLAPGGIVRIQRSGREPGTCPHPRCWPRLRPGSFQWALAGAGTRSEEHTSELQSRGHLVCRLLLEKKKTTITPSGTPVSSSQSSCIVVY